MALTKRQRFEILKRDNFTCRYCGRQAPAVKLEVDHLMPQRLGGDDSAANLITSCHDCNAGKTGRELSDRKYELDLSELNAPVWGQWV